MKVGLGGISMGEACERNLALRKDADRIIQESLKAVLPDQAVLRALKDFSPGAGRILLVSAGKAAWQMAKAAVEALGRVDAGVVITKYGHVMGEIPGISCLEAGHPIPDSGSFAATRAALELVSGLSEEDNVLFLRRGKLTAGEPPYTGRGAYGCHRTAAGLRRGYHGDKHDTQAAFSGKGRAFCLGLRAGEGFQHRAQ